MLIYIDDRDKSIYDDLQGDAPYNLILILKSLELATGGLRIL